MHTIKNTMKIICGLQELFLQISLMTLHSFIDKVLLSIISTSSHFSTNK